MNIKWDLIVVDELFAIHGMGIAAFFRKYFNVPYVIYSTSQMMSTTTVYMGLCELFQLNIFNTTLFLARNLVDRPYLITRDAGSVEELYNVTNFFHRIMNFYNSGAEIVGNFLCKSSNFSCIA